VWKHTLPHTANDEPIGYETFVVNVMETTAVSSFALVTAKKIRFRSTLAGFGHRRRKKYVMETGRLPYLSFHLCSVLRILFYNHQIYIAKTLILQILYSVLSARLRRLHCPCLIFVFILRTEHS
ncbi:hypothetical protein, partial [Extensimonas sp. H3M7-6]|uniref:hypothetical protein n=1 Tax=Extensimonas soli TaxID=3031322 RepID=UPI0023DA892E